MGWRVHDGASCKAAAGATRGWRGKKVRTQRWRQLQWRRLSSVSSWESQRRQHLGGLNAATPNLASIQWTRGLQCKTNSLCSALYTKTRRGCLQCNGLRFVGHRCACEKALEGGTGNETVPHAKCAASDMQLQESMHWTDECCKRMHRGNEIRKDGPVRPLSPYLTDVVGVSDSLYTAFHWRIYMCYGRLCHQIECLSCLARSLIAKRIFWPAIGIHCCLSQMMAALPADPCFHLLTYR